MLAWDLKVGAERGAMQSFTSRQYALLCFRVIRETVSTMRPPFAERCLEETVSFVEETMLQCRNALCGVSVNPVATEEFFEKNFALQDGESSIGASILMALSEYVEAFPDELSLDSAMDIMSACYEAVLNNAQLGRIVTPEMELGNRECAAAIAMQRHAIQEISADGQIAI